MNEGENMYTKKLSKIGNSRGIVIDKSILQLLNIDDETPIKIEVFGNKLVIGSASDEKTDFDKALERSNSKFLKAYKRLSE